MFNSFARAVSSLIFFALSSLRFMKFEPPVLPIVSVPPKRVGEVSVPCAASVSASGVPCCRVGSPREVHGAVVVSYTDVSGGATVSRCSPRMAMRIIRSKRSPIVCTHSRFTTSSRYAVKGRTLKGQRGFGQGGSRSGILIGSDIYAKNNSAKCQERESLATTLEAFFAAVATPPVSSHRLSLPES